MPSSGSQTPTGFVALTATPPQPYIVSQYSSDEIQVPAIGHRPPANTPASDYSLTPQLPEPITQITRPRKVSSLNLVHFVDLRAVTYEGTVNENLICPICHSPLVDPITTECDHIFCRSCIEESVAHNTGAKTCPIDRSVLQQDVMMMKRAPKIILNQLDGLMAKCPCCSRSFARSMLANHMEKYCPEALTRCPGRNTDKECLENVKRKYNDKGCLHYTTECPDCFDSLVQVDMEEHREDLCKERFRECEHCGNEILRYRQSDHEKECSGFIAPCQWACYGCPHESKRKDLHLHKEECSMKAVGPMTDMLRKEIGDLRSELRTSTESNQRLERRIKFMENGAARDFAQPLYTSDLSNPASLPILPEPANTEPLDSGHQYLLSLLEAQESNLSHLSNSLTESEAKQTTMLFNETIPIKNELAEIRSMQQTTSMHVRWLMRFRMQENNRRVGGGPGPSNNGGSYGGQGTDGGASGGDSLLPRRLSDTMSRDLVTKL